ncbi:MAG TPA: ribokinase [Thermoanaerobaculia bacterium]|jgi:ribokinase
MPNARVTVMGSFVADLSFRTPRLPAWGETVLGTEFRLGPGGKGSNQAVAAARLGARVSFICKLGRDAFGDLARRTYANDGVDTRFVFDCDDHGTGGAAIILDQVSGENAIVVVPGSCFTLKEEDVDNARDAIDGAAIFMTQLELPLATVEHGLRLARSLGVRTILNPAPAFALDDAVFPLCDFMTPNEVEAAMLTGESDPARAAGALLDRGAGAAVITLGAQGALVKTATIHELVPAVDAGPVVETTGAGDAFNAGFAVALAEGRDVVEATRFGCAVAGISVTRPGTAQSMPRRDEVEALLRR